MRLLDAFGKELIIVETVGVGQTELDIADMADTTVVLVVPEGGDTVQTMKAGLMEIADIFVVNKSDRDGADRMCMDLRTLIDIHSHNVPWQTPVLALQAHLSIGIAALYEAISSHRQTLEDTGGLQQRRGAQRRQELFDLLQQRLRASLIERLEHDETLQALVAGVQAATVDPYTGAQQILETYRRSWALTEEGHDDQTIAAAND